jgi:hypothetical protein
MGGFGVKIYCLANLIVAWTVPHFIQELTIIYMLVHIYICTNISFMIYFESKLMKTFSCRCQDCADGGFEPETALPLLIRVTTTQGTML